MNSFISIGSKHGLCYYLGMITLNVIQRVFRLKYKNQLGTCFTIEVEGSQYLVTAKHVLEIKDLKKQTVDSLHDGEQVEIFRNGQWVSAEVSNVRHSEISDISIFTIKVNIPAHPMEATSDGISYGQDLYFLGFPYGLSSNVGALNRDFPMPLVKKGILSAFLTEEVGRPLLIDGHNNPGFSGGPVVFKLQDSNAFRVAGVIHGYKPEYKVENGILVPIENTNSNIIIAYPIENALSLIKNI